MAGLCIHGPIDLMPQSIGVNLSKILDGQTKILEGQKLAITDEIMAISQLLEAHARAAL